MESNSLLFSKYLYAVVDRYTYLGCDGPYFESPGKAIIAKLWSFLSLKFDHPIVSMAATYIIDADRINGSLPETANIVFPNNNWVLIRVRNSKETLKYEDDSTGKYKFTHQYNTRFYTSRTGVDMDAEFKKRSVFIKTTAEFNFDYKLFDSSNTWINYTLLSTEPFMKINIEKSFSNLEVTNRSLMTTVSKYFEDGAYRVNRWHNLFDEKSVTNIDWETVWLDFLILRGQNQSPMFIRSKFIEMETRYFKDVFHVIPSAIFNRDVLVVLSENINDITDIISLCCVNKTSYNSLIASNSGVASAIRRKFLPSIDRCCPTAKSYDKDVLIIKDKVRKTGFVMFPGVEHGRLQIGVAFFNEDFKNNTESTLITAHDRLLPISSVASLNLIRECNSFMSMFMFFIQAESYVPDIHLVYGRSELLLNMKTTFPGLTDRLNEDMFNFDKNLHLTVTPNIFHPLSKDATFYADHLNNLCLKGGPQFDIAVHQFFLNKTFVHKLNKFKVLEKQREQIDIYAKQNPNVKLSMDYEKARRIVLVSKLIFRNAEGEVAAVFVGLASYKLDVKKSIHWMMFLNEKYPKSFNYYPTAMFTDDRETVERMCNKSGDSTLKDLMKSFKFVYSDLFRNDKVSSLYMAYMVLMSSIRRCVLVHELTDVKWETNFAEEMKK